MSYLGVYNLTIDNQRWKDVKDEAHESKMLRHNIYIKREISQCLRMESKIQSICLHVLGVKFLRLHLGMF